MTSSSLLFSCLAGTLILLPACAGPRDREARLEAELHRMRDHAHAMEAEVEGLRSRMHAMTYEREREAMHLEERAHALEREHAEREHERHDRNEGGHAKTVHELMRTAIEVLVETDRVDLAEKMEHALHASKLEREGAHGPDAMHVRETAPSAGNTAEILMHVANQLKEGGHEKQAERMRGLGREWMQRAEHEREMQGREGVDHEARQAFERLHGRIAEVEERLAAMTNRLEEVLARMEELSPRGD